MSVAAKKAPARIQRPPGVSASDHAINALTQAIRDGLYAAGDRLVESQLTRELGVSRSTLREVFRRLSSEGLVQLEPNRGAVVRSLTRHDVIELLNVREVLEGYAAGLAALNVGASEEQYQRIREMLEHIAAVRSDDEGIDHIQDNLIFHEFVNELSGNKTLTQQIRQLQMPAARSWFFDQMQSADWLRSLNEHEQILFAIQEGDQALAEQLMRAHVRRARKLFENFPDDADEGRERD